MYKTAIARTAMVLGVAGLFGGPALAQDLDDPMQPTTARPEPARQAEPEPSTRPAPPQRFLPVNYTLNEVYVLGRIQRARINGSWYVPGDQLINGTIIDIMPHAVVVEADDLFHVLYLDRERALFNFSKEVQ